jgi:hypothetical protein
MPAGEFIITIEQPESRPPPPPPGPAPDPKMCTALADTDIDGGQLSKACDQKAHVCMKPGATTQQQCCDGCTATKDCAAWVHDTAGKSCWLMASADGTKHANDRTAGGKIGAGSGNTPKPTHIKVRVEVTDVAYQGTTVLWEIDDLDSVSQNLNWPPPITPGDKPQAYAIKDYPRFYTPPWGPTPIPAGVTVDPALKDTNGYEYAHKQSDVACDF